MAFAITTFYHFFELGAERLPEVEAELERIAAELDVAGLVIMAPEGLNSTVAVPAEKLDALKASLRAIPGCESLEFKDSSAPKKPFKRFKIKVRDEIVTAGRSDLIPNQGNHRHLSPEEWDAVLDSDEDVVLLDTRNRYEWELGTFKGAIKPPIEMFSDLPKFVEEQNIPKDKKMLMFCTGGIRCEKAILQMEELGYENVYQLKGGILKYFEERPNSNYEGECFVFDHRVAVDQELRPTRRFDLCPHCGDPGDVKIECSLCSTEGTICSRCLELEESRKTCSKNCAHHFERRQKQAAPEVQAEAAPETH